MKHLLATLILALAATGANASIIYDVDRTFYDDTGMVTGTVTGFITTNGTIGTLVVGDIEDWSLTLSADNINGGIPDTIVMAGGVTSLAGTAVEATIDGQLTFDFGADEDSLLFLAGASNNFWCLETQFCTGDGINFAEQIGRNDNGQSVAQLVEYDNTTTIVFANAAVIPVPAAVWLFGSGLLGLIGFARRKR